MSRGSAQGRPPRRAAQNPFHSTWVRLLRYRSPLYLHLKLYVLTSLVSLVVARPVSRTVEAAAEEVAEQIRWQKGAKERPRRVVEASVVRASTDPPSTLRRWRHRMKDLAGVRGLVARSGTDTLRYPEIGKEAMVRCVSRALRATGLG